MAHYAQDTTVPAERSRAEIERILIRYGADKFMSGFDSNRSMIMFEARGRRVRFVLPIPEVSQFDHTETGRSRKPTKRREAYEQEVRRRWRALALAIKAKPEAVDTRITSFEDEFMAHIVLPSGETVGDWLAPQIAQSYSTGSMPPLLPAGDVHDY